MDNSSVVSSTAHLSRFSDLTDLVRREGTDGGEFPVIAPFTGEQIGTTPACTPEDVRAAVARARAAVAAWSSTSPRERRRILLRFHDLVLDRQEDLIDLMQIETGKARRHALEELLDVANTTRYYAYRAEAFLRSQRVRGAVPLLTRTVVHYHPVGVVGLITPWNYPLTLVLSDAVPALLAGNTVVVKPAQVTSLTALRGAALLYEAGVPRDVFQVVTGSGSRLGPALIDSVDFIGFTGSTETGRMIARQAGERLIPASMELGGKNPAIVFDDVDLERAVGGLLTACFSNAGQLCISIERLYVQSGVYDRFVAEFTERTRRLRLGPGFSYDVDVGSLISNDQLERVREHVSDALEKGAKLLAGGRHRPDLGPYFFEPTVLEGVTDSMKLAREETFGPVVAVYRFDTVDEVIRKVNDSDYGLNACIWSRNTRRAAEVARRIQCGTVNINEGYSAAWGSVDAPMGGMKASGLDRRHGIRGILKYTEPQTVATQYLRPISSTPGSDDQFRARYMNRLLRILRRVPGLR